MGGADPHRAHPAAIGAHRFPAGSMGPKVEAACHFAQATGRRAAIGALADIELIVRGERGTLIDPCFTGHLLSRLAVGLGSHPKGAV